MPNACSYGDSKLMEGVFLHGSPPNLFSSSILCFGVTSIPICALSLLIYISTKQWLRIPFLPGFLLVISVVFLPVSLEWNGCQCSLAYISLPTNDVDHFYVFIINLYFFALTVHLPMIQLDWFYLYIIFWVLYIFWIWILY